MNPQTQTEANNNIRDYLNREFNAFIEHEKTIDQLGDELCNYCTLEKKKVYGVPGGYVAGCEGSRCDDAYENYLATEEEKK